MAASILSVFGLFGCLMCCGGCVGIAGWVGTGVAYFKTYQKDKKIDKSVKQARSRMESKICAAEQNQ